MHENERTLRALFDRVWNNNDLNAIDELIAESYTVHSDPGDPWDGKELTREGFRERMVLSRVAHARLHVFPRQWTKPHRVSP